MVLDLCPLIVGASYLQLSNMEPERKLFSFGIITDIQYADQDDANNHHYRHSVLLLREVIEAWNQRQNTAKLDFAMQLGDIIDGQNGKEALELILKEINKFNGKIYNILGNHEISQMLRVNLAPNGLTFEQNQSGLTDLKAYYDFYPHEKYCFVALDTFEISVLGYKKDHPRHMEAHTILATKNPNQDKECTDGMTGSSQRFLSFNGAVTKEQLDWLDSVLSQAQKCKKWVIVTGIYK